MSLSDQRNTELFMQVLGVAMAAAAWSIVVFPRITVVWKGGNRAPLSMRSKIISALAMTAFCLAAFRVYPIYCAMLFAGCVALLFVQAANDRNTYARLHPAIGISPAPITRRQGWLALCSVDALVFTLSGSALVRDSRYPPVTQEQHIVHLMGLGFFVMSVIGAIALVVNRPRTDA